MKSFLFICILFYISNLFAQDFTQNSDLEIITQSQEFFLKAPHCTDLNSELLALREWTQNLKESVSSTPPFNDKNPSEINSCLVSLKGQIPKIMQSLQGFKPQQAGPNCWNTTLVAAQLLRWTRFSSPQEMSFWMNSPYCKRISPSENLHAGDVMAMRSLPRSEESRQGFEESHGMIYVSPHLVFSKNTSLKSVYELQSPHLIFQTFRVDDSKCFRNQGEGCSHWVDFYRCRSSWDDYNQLKNRDPQFKQLSLEIEKIESQLSLYVMKGQAPNFMRYSILKISPAYKKILDFKDSYIKIYDFKDSEKKLNELAQQVNQLMESHHEVAKIFFLKAHLETIESLKAQLRILNKN